MSRITGVALLLVILVVSFYSTASQLPKRPIHECGCTVHPNGKPLCLKQQKQNSTNQIEDLGRCLCSKMDKQMFKKACERFRKFRKTLLSHIPSTPL